MQFPYLHKGQHTTAPDRKPPRPEAEAAKIVGCELPEGEIPVEPSISPDRKLPAKRPESEAVKVVGYEESEGEIPVKLSTAKGVYKGRAFFDAAIKYPSLALFIDREHALIIEPTDVVGSSGSTDNPFRRLGIAKFETSYAPEFLTTMEHIRTVTII
jgi:hypothetical protein